MDEDDHDLSFDLFLLGIRMKPLEFYSQETRMLFFETCAWFGANAYDGVCFEY